MRPMTTTCLRCCIYVRLQASCARIDFSSQSLDFVCSVSRCLHTLWIIQRVLKKAVESLEEGDLEEYWERRKCSSKTSGWCWENPLLSLVR